MSEKKGRHTLLSELPALTEEQVEASNAATLLEVVSEVVLEVVPELKAKPRLVAPANPTRASHQLSTWSAPPTSVLLVHKQCSDVVNKAVGEVLEYLQKTYPGLRVLVEGHTAQDHPEFDVVVLDEGTTPQQLFPHTHLILALGGDGTALHAASLFGEGECPPLLCFSMGSLGFLLPFHIRTFRETLARTLSGSVSILYRMRLECRFLDKDDRRIEGSPESWQVMNELVLHRGKYSHLAVLDVYLNGEHLTEAICDGVMISTPTGSTAYNLSSGGPIAHPESDTLLLTPIAPRSLSFRPVVLPGDATMKLRISPRARAPATLSLDGKEVGMLRQGDQVVVRRSPWPMPCIERGGGPGKGWLKDINQLLLFNSGFVNKAKL